MLTIFSNNNALIQTLKVNPFIQAIAQCQCVKPDLARLGSNSVQTRSNSESGSVSNSAIPEYLIKLTLVTIQFLLPSIYLKMLILLF